ncbi:MAG: DedA family protein [Pseudomonadota bacterium]|nr:DedA family protein [Pseudomonadota bacterium]
MISTVYHSIINLAKTKYATICLMLVSFTEAIFFPIPPDVILVPMCLAKKHKAFVYASITTLFSIFGGVIGYYIGLFFWVQLGAPLVAYLGFADAISEFSKLYDEIGMLMIFIGAITPFPYKIVALVSGALGFPFFIFVFASVTSRGLRFFVIAGLIYIFGKTVEVFIKRYLGILFLMLVLIIVGLYLYRHG